MVKINGYITGFQMIAQKGYVTCIVTYLPGVALLNKHLNRLRHKTYVFFIV